MKNQRKPGAPKFKWPTRRPKNPMAEKTEPAVSQWPELVALDKRLTKLCEDVTHWKMTAETARDGLLARDNLKRILLEATKQLRAAGFVLNKRGEGDEARKCYALEERIHKAMYIKRGDGASAAEMAGLG